MAYEFTFTSRFQKHFKELTTQEKSDLKSTLRSNSWILSRFARSNWKLYFKSTLFFLYSIRYTSHIISTLTHVFLYKIKIICYTSYLANKYKFYFRQWNYHTSLVHLYLILSLYKMRAKIRQDFYKLWPSINSNIQDKNSINIFILSISSFTVIRFT